MDISHRINSAQPITAPVEGDAGGGADHHGGEGRLTTEVSVHDAAALACRK